MKDIVKIVSFIKSRTLIHREFKNFIHEIDAEQDDVIYLTDVCCLSRGKVLKRFFDLKNELLEIAASKGKMFFST